MKHTLLFGISTTALLLGACADNEVYPNIAEDIVLSSSSSSSQESSLSSSSAQTSAPFMGVKPKGSRLSSAAPSPTGRPPLQPSSMGNRPSLQPSSEASVTLIAEMNAASDVTTLSDEEFKTALLAAMEAMQARRPQSSTDSTRPTPPAGTFPPELQALLTAAVSFYSYTDTRGQQALIALDGEGAIMVKWPPAMGQGGPGGMPPPMNGQ